MADPDLVAIAAFAPLFGAPGFKAGQVVTSETRQDGVTQMPYVSLGEQAMAFVRTAYDHGWIRSDFPWPEWAGSPEAARLRDDPGALAEASPDQLAHLLTVCIRQDRFVEGALLDAFESGLILRIAQRAVTLAGERR